MSGNTKLRGFGPNGVVILQRWGKAARVKVSEDSLDALRLACTDTLPKEPPTVSEYKREFDASFDPRTGNINLELSPDIVPDLVSMVSCYKDKFSGSDSTEAVRKIELASEWESFLESALKDRRAFFDIDEPGVS